MSGKLDIASLLKKIEVRKNAISEELEGFFQYVKSAASHLNDGQEDLFEITFDDIQIMLECLEMLDSSNKVSGSKKEKINRLHWKLYCFWVKNNKDKK